MIGGKRRVTPFSIGSSTLVLADLAAAKGTGIRGRIVLAIGLAALLAGSGFVAGRVTSSHGPAVASASPVVVGRVVLNGRGVPGADVTVYAWPNQAVVTSLKVGEPVPQVLVGSAVSSGSGSYSISTTNWPGIRRSATNGVVNFYVMAIGRCRVVTYFFPRKIVRTATGPALAANTDSETTPQLTVQHANLSLPARAPGKCLRGSAG